MKLEERVENNDTHLLGNAKMMWERKHSPQAQIANEARQEGEEGHCLESGDNPQRKEEGGSDRSAPSQMVISSPRLGLMNGQLHST